MSSRQPSAEGRRSERFELALFSPVDISFLVFFRIVVGVTLLWVVWEYFRFGQVRSLAERPFHFTYHGFEWVEAWPLAAMQIHFGLLALFALFVACGFLYRLSAIASFVGFSYVFLLEKADYFNHYYLICLFLFLLVFLPAHHLFSVDSLLRPKLRSALIPKWTLWLVRFQVGLPYVYGGIAKLNADWLRGQPMQIWLSRGPLRELFGPVVSEPWVALLFSWGGAIFDLAIVPLLLWKRTRVSAFVCAVLFHLMNAIMFEIDVFPWMMIAATLVFFPPDSIRRWLRKANPTKVSLQSVTPCDWRRKLIVASLILYTGFHLTFPFRHWLIPGNAHWTEEGHRFAWRMMLRTKLNAVQFIVIDRKTGESEPAEFLQWLTPRQLNKMSRDPEMLREYSHFLRREYLESWGKEVEIRVVALCSLNGRKPQQLLDPDVDLAREPRRWFQQSWILPLNEPFRQQPWDKPVPLWPQLVSVRLPTALPASRNQTKSNNDVELATEKQKRIWDHEHVTFQLETYFGHPFAQALKSRSHESLQRFFLEDFQGWLPKGPHRQETQKGIFSEQSWQLGTDSTSRKSSPLETGEYFLKLLREFDSIGSIRFKVLQINQQSPSHWKTKLSLTAFGSRENKPVDLQLVSEADFRFSVEEEIAAGKILSSWRVKSEVVRRSERPLMEEITKRVGLANLPIRDNWSVSVDQIDAEHIQVAVEDFDRDGFQDIAVASIYGPPLLLRAVEGKQFENIAEDMGIKRWYATETHLTWLVGWIDFDNDNFPDLLIGDSLYRNVGGLRFENVTAASGLRFQTEPKGFSVVDYDCDGNLDLYILYQQARHLPLPDKEPWVGDEASGAPNHLWRNEGNGRFRNVTDEMNAGGGRGHSFAAAWLFLDDDRYPDLYIANDFGKNVLLRNRGQGPFEDITEVAGVGDFATSMGVSAGDLNNDGRSEIYVGNMYSKMGRRIIAHVNEADYPEGVYEGILGACAGNRLYQPTANEERFREVSESLGVNQVGWSYATAMGDFDGDGWLDLYSTAGYMSFNRKRPDG